MRTARIRFERRRLYHLGAAAAAFGEDGEAGGGRGRASTSASFHSRGETLPSALPWEAEGKLAAVKRTRAGPDNMRANIDVL